MAAAPPTTSRSRKTSAVEAGSKLPLLLEQSLAAGLGGSSAHRGIFGSIRFPANLSSAPAKFMLVTALQQQKDAHGSSTPSTAERDLARERVIPDCSPGEGDRGGVDLT